MLGPFFGQAGKVVDSLRTLIWDFDGSGGLRSVPDYMPSGQQGLGDPLGIKACTCLCLKRVAK